MQDHFDVRLVRKSLLTCEILGGLFGFGLELRNGNLLFGHVHLPLKYDYCSRFVISYAVTTRILPRRHFTVMLLHTGVQWLNPDRHTL